MSTWYRSQTVHRLFLFSLASSLRSYRNIETMSFVPSLKKRWWAWGFTS